MVPEILYLLLVSRSLWDRSLKPSTHDYNSRLKQGLATVIVYVHSQWPLCALWEEDNVQPGLSLQNSPQSLQEHPEFYIEADVLPPQ